MGNQQSRGAGLGPGGGEVRGSVVNDFLEWNKDCCCAKQSSSEEKAAIALFQGGHRRWDRPDYQGRRGVRVPAWGDSDASTVAGPEPSIAVSSFVPSRRSGGEGAGGTSEPTGAASAANRSSGGSRWGLSVAVSDATEPSPRGTERSPTKGSVRSPTISTERSPTSGAIRSSAGAVIKPATEDFARESRKILAQHLEKKDEWSFLDHQLQMDKIKAGFHGEGFKLRKVEAMKETNRVLMDEMKKMRQKDTVGVKANFFAPIQFRESRDMSDFQRVPWELQQRLNLHANGTLNMTTDTKAEKLIERIDDETSRVTAEDLQAVNATSPLDKREVLLKMYENDPRLGRILDKYDWEERRMREIRMAQSQKHKSLKNIMEQEHEQHKPRRHRARGGAASKEDRKVNAWGTIGDVDLIDEPVENVPGRAGRVERKEESREEQQGARSRRSYSSDKKSARRSSTNASVSPGQQLPKDESLYFDLGIAHLSPMARSRASEKWTEREDAQAARGSQALS